MVDKHVQVPFVDLQKQHEVIGDAIDQAIARVVARQHFVLGEELSLFEQEFGSYLGAAHVIGVGSGTDALVLALLALGIGPGDEVIVPANSFIASALAVTETGATPVLTDVDAETYLLTPEIIESAITSRTKVIMPVHLYGAPCDMPAIMALAKKHKLKVIEDACQAHGAKLHGKALGTFGDAAAFSFYPTKNLGAYGDGGAVITNDSQIHEQVLLLRNYGQRVKYHHDQLGRNSRLDEMQAAILRAKLPFLDRENEVRNSAAEKYRDALAGTFKIQSLISGAKSSYHLFVMEHDNRDMLMRQLSEQGIQTQVHYPVPIHLQECYKNLGYHPGSLPVTEKAARRLLSLPLHGYITLDELNPVIETLKKIS